MSCAACSSWNCSQSAWPQLECEVGGLSILLEMLLQYQGHDPPALQGQKVPMGQSHLLFVGLTAVYIWNCPAGPPGMPGLIWKTSFHCLPVCWAEVVLPPGTHWDEEIRAALWCKKRSQSLGVNLEPVRGLGCSQTSVRFLA